MKRINHFLDLLNKEDIFLGKSHHSSTSSIDNYFPSNEFRSLDDYMEIAGLYNVNPNYLGNY